MDLKAADYVVVIVSDLDKSLHFYTEVLGLPLHHRAPNDKFAELDTGVTHIALYTRDGMAETLKREISAPDKSQPGFELGFKVDDADAAYAEAIAAGAESAVEPTTKFWGQRTAYVYDPDGHLIEFAQELPKED